MEEEAVFKLWPGIYFLWNLRIAHLTYLSKDATVDTHVSRALMSVHVERQVRKRTMKRGGTASEEQPDVSSLSYNLKSK